MRLLNNYTRNICIRACQNRHVEILAGMASALDATDRFSTGLDDVWNLLSHLPRLSNVESIRPTFSVTPS
ncbi:hypothetical protein RSAG8_08637, partial [Rhizoctonia solani AG-8 WAC10335]